MIRLPLALLLGIALTAAACAAQVEALPTDADVIVEMKDYSVNLSVATMKAGTVKFAIKNVGAMEHQFDLLKTDLPFDKLPIDGALAKAKEDGLVKQVKSIGIGKVAVVTADLAAGRYVIICNVAGHYQLGMRASLIIE